MKLVIISVPSNVSINDIQAACAEFADVLELPNLKVNVLEEGDLEIKSANEIVTPIIDKIAQNCYTLARISLVVTCVPWRMPTKSETRFKNLLRGGVKSLRYASCVCAQRTIKSAKGM